MKPVSVSVGTDADDIEIEAYFEKSMISEAGGRSVDGGDIQISASKNAISYDERDDDQEIDLIQLSRSSSDDEEEATRISETVFAVRDESEAREENEPREQAEVEAVPETLDSIPEDSFNGENERKGDNAEEQPDEIDSEEACIQKESDVKLDDEDAVNKASIESEGATNLLDTSVDQMKDTKLSHISSVEVEVSDSTGAMEEFETGDELIPSPKFQSEEYAIFKAPEEKEVSNDSEECLEELAPNSVEPTTEIQPVIEEQEQETKQDVVIKESNEASTVEGKFMEVEDETEKVEISTGIEQSLEAQKIVVEKGSELSPELSHLPEDSAMVSEKEQQPDPCLGGDDFEQQIEKGDNEENIVVWAAEDAQESHEECDAFDEVDENPTMKSSNLFSEKVEDSATDQEKFSENSDANVTETKQSGSQDDLQIQLLSEKAKTVALEQSLKARQEMLLQEKERARKSQVELSELKKQIEQDERVGTEKVKLQFIESVRAEAETKLKDNETIIHFLEDSIAKKQVLLDTQLEKSKTLQRSRQEIESLQSDCDKLNKRLEEDLAKKSSLLQQVEGADAKLSENEEAIALLQKSNENTERLMEEEKRSIKALEETQKERQLLLQECNELSNKLENGLSKKAALEQAAAAAELTVAENESSMRALEESNAKKQELLEVQQEKVESLERVGRERESLLKNCQRLSRGLEAGIAKQNSLQTMKRVKIQELEELTKKQQKLIESEEEQVKNLDYALARKQALLELEEMKEKTLIQTIAQKDALLEAEANKVKELEVVCAEKQMLLVTEKNVIKSIEKAKKEKENLFKNDRALVNDLHHLLSEKEVLLDKKQKTQEEIRRRSEEIEALLSKEKGLLENANEIKKLKLSVLAAKDRTIKEIEARIAVKEELLKKEQAIAHGVEHYQQRRRDLATGGLNWVVDTGLSISHLAMTPYMVMQRQRSIFAEFAMRNAEIIQNPRAYLTGSVTIFITDSSAHLKKSTSILVKNSTALAKGSATTLKNTLMENSTSLMKNSSSLAKGSAATLKNALMEKSTSLMKNSSSFMNGSAVPLTKALMEKSASLMKNSAVIVKKALINDSTTTLLNDSTALLKNALDLRGKVYIYQFADFIGLGALYRHL